MAELSLPLVRSWFETIGVAAAHALKMIHSSPNGELSEVDTIDYSLVSGHLFQGGWHHHSHATAPNYFTPDHIGSELFRMLPRFQQEAKFATVLPTPTIYEIVSALMQFAHSKELYAGLIKKNGTLYDKLQRSLESDGGLLDLRTASPELAELRALVGTPLEKRFDALKSMIDAAHVESIGKFYRPHEYHAVRRDVVHARQQMSQAFDRYRRMSGDPKSWDFRNLVDASNWGLCFGLKRVGKTFDLRFATPLSRSVREQQSLGGILAAHSLPVALFLRLKSLEIAAGKPTGIGLQAEAKEWTLSIELKARTCAAAVANIADLGQLSSAKRDDVAFFWSTYVAPLIQKPPANGASAPSPIVPPRSSGDLVQQLEQSAGKTIEFSKFLLDFDRTESRTSCSPIPG